MSYRVAPKSHLLASLHEIYKKHKHLSFNQTVYCTNLRATLAVKVNGQGQTAPTF